jgi:hypothetical protein
MYFEASGKVQIAFFQHDQKDGPGFEIDPQTKKFKKVLWRKDQLANWESIVF